VELVVVGASWGGLHAISTLLDGLPDGLDAPIVIAQHRSADPRNTGKKRQRPPGAMAAAQRVSHSPPVWRALLEAYWVSPLAIPDLPPQPR